MRQRKEINKQKASDRMKAYHAKKKFEKQTREINETYENQNAPAPLTEYLLDEENIEQLEDDLVVKYNARLENFPDIKCTKYTFDCNNIIITVGFLYDKVIKYREREH